MPAPKKVNPEIETPEDNTDVETVAKTQAEPSKFYQVRSREYMVTFPPYSLILYPGTTAVLTEEHFELLHPTHKAMLDVTVITEAQFIDLFAKQGKIGWVG